MATIELDELLDSVVVTLDPVGAAGAVVVPWAGLHLTLDLTEAGRLIRVVAPLQSNGSYSAAAVAALLGLPELAAPMSGDSPIEVSVAMEPTAQRVLASLAVGTVGRADGAAWDLELQKLSHELHLAVGLEPDVDLPDLDAWLRAVADKGTLVGDDGLGADAAAVAVDDPDLQVGVDRLVGRSRVAASRGGELIVPTGPVPLLLTEQRARVESGAWRWDEAALVVDPVGPAGSFVVSIGELRVESDFAEPTRVLRAAGLPATDGDPDWAASQLVRRLGPVLVLQRDLDLLVDANDSAQDIALVRAELAISYADLRDRRFAGADELVLLTAEQAVQELVQAWGAQLEALAQRAPNLVDVLGDLVDTSLLVPPAMPGFRGGRGTPGFGQELGTPVLDPTTDDDLQALFASLGGSRIDPATGTVALSASAQLALAPDGPDASVRVIIEAGPVARLEVGAPVGPVRAIRIRLHRDLELLGEVVLEITGPTTTTIPVAGIADELDVEIVEPASAAEATAAARSALLAELAGPPSPVRWLGAADLWADLGEADRAAIAIERAALLVSPAVGWPLVSRALLLGSAWAAGRIRPPEHFVPVWRRRSTGP